MLFIIPALSKLLNSLQENKSDIPSCTEEEFGFLSELLQSKELNALVNVHNKILSNVKDDKFFPVLSNSMDIDVEVLDLLSTKTHISPECKELFHLLQKPHIQVMKSRWFFRKQQHTFHCIFFQNFYITFFLLLIFCPSTTLFCIISFLYE